jgi:DNA-directed RNA polymerase specialized sigma24 family protein
MVLAASLIEWLMDQTEVMAVPTEASRRAEFAELYQRELDLQFRRARLIVGSKAAADDVVHDAFVEIWRRWDTIRDPGPDLNRAVVNNAMKAKQAGNRRAGILRRFFTGAGTESGTEVLTDVLRQLPVKHRTAIVLRYYAGFSDLEIAAAMDCPTGSVGPWIHRGLEQLRKALS